MKTVLGSRRHRHVARVGIFLIAIALVMGSVACDDTYELTISSTAGGSVTTPGEGTSTYDAGTVVELVATPDDGYEFHAWTGDTEHIADPDSVSTNITMNGDYSITANFVTRGETSPIRP